MSEARIGDRERTTQNRVVRLFQERLHYDYLGDWHKRADNSNIEEELLRGNLLARGYDDGDITRAIEKLESAASINPHDPLYDANKAVYNLLRYGIKLSSAGEQTKTIWPIDWSTANANHFAIAEEVTIAGENTKRPDVVLYVNGIALGVLELKRSSVSMREGIRQNIGNQESQFIRPFFATNQVLFAGNDTEGLRYGAIGAAEKYWLLWKEPVASEHTALTYLDQQLIQMCEKARFLELIHDFVAFDKGAKKLPRYNQFFAVKAAQKRIENREGGIIWHTQGSGKSLTMVWLSKWIRENVENSRVLIITDRVELDEQIEGNFEGVGESIYRTDSGANLIATLNSADKPLICSLIHKFRGGDTDEEDARATDDFIAGMTLPAGFSAKGDVFVFVDECHRTQSGRMHAAMKQILPDSMFVGFTGTPLLKKDKATSLETFGTYIHTYKFNEAVKDGVIVDLKYEARSIDQNIDASSQDRIDQWFEAKTRGLNDYAQTELKKRWATMQSVLTSADRARKIVADILLDMQIKERLADGRGNAILVGSSIYQACKFYELFEATELKGHCAIVTSYEPNTHEASLEQTGEGKTEKLKQYEVYNRMLAEFGFSDVEKFEEEVKDRFVKKPAEMKLLIVVDKLLTGFDAPSATYLYIDKAMRDHGLFQAICRVNRLDGDDKEYGYIIDYRDLFGSLEKAVSDYTSDAFDAYDPDDVSGLLTSRIEKGREDLDEAREWVKSIIEPVAPPKALKDYLSWFVWEEFGNDEQLKEREPRRIELYKSVGKFLRRYGELAADLSEAGYSDEDIKTLAKEAEHFEKIKMEVAQASGDFEDLKQFEPGMRWLLDTYIKASDSEQVVDFGEDGILEIIAKNGADATDGMNNDKKETAAAAITQNVRRLIVDKSVVNPAYYEKLSRILEDLIQRRREQAIEYKEYLRNLIEIAKNAKSGPADGDYPDDVRSQGQKALYDLAKSSESGDAPDIMALDAQIRSSAPADWRGSFMKERSVKKIIHRAGYSGDMAEQIFNIIKANEEY